MTDDKKSKNCKRRYEKPKVREIELATREVLGFGCKLNTGEGDNSGEACDVGSCTGPDNS